MFDIDVFRQDPSIYYNMARDLLYDPGVRSPSLVHNKLVSLECRGLVKAVITQNVDLLHTRAGSTRVYEIHGSPATHSCVQCGFSCGFDEIVDTVLAGMIPQCARCGGTMKPDIVFFGENLPEAVFAGAMKEARVSDLMLVLGSSLVVYPAASIPETCLRSGGKIIIVNDLPTHLDREAFLRFEDLETVFSYIDGRLREGE
jgi:NAD-dependent deacetylase